MRWGMTSKHLAIPRPVYRAFEGAADHARRCPSHSCVNTAPHPQRWGCTFPLISPLTGLEIPASRAESAVNQHTTATTPRASQIWLSRVWGHGARLSGSAAGPGRLPALASGRAHGRIGVRHLSGPIGQAALGSTQGEHPSTTYLVYYSSKLN